MNLARAVQVSIDTAVRPCEDRKIRGMATSPQDFDSIGRVGLRGEVRWWKSTLWGMIHGGFLGRGAVVMVGRRKEGESLRAHLAYPPSHCGYPQHALSRLLFVLVSTGC